MTNHSSGPLANPRKTLRRRILWSAMTPPLVMFGIALVVGIRHIGGLTDDATRLRFEREATSVLWTVDRELASVESFAGRIAFALETHQSIEDDELLEVLRTAGQPPELTSATVLARTDAEHHLGAAFLLRHESDSLATTPLTASARSRIGSWLRGLESTPSSGWYALAAPDSLLSFARPVASSSGFNGLILIDVPRSGILQRVDAATQIPLVILTPNGAITNGVASALPGSGEASGDAGPTLPDQLREALRERPDLGSGGWYDDGTFSILVRPMSRPDWLFAARVDWLTSLVPVREISLRGLLLLIVMVGGTAVLVRLGTGRLTRPILTLRNVATRIAGGERDVQIPDLGEDELGALGDAFRDMAHQLSERENQLKEERERQFGNLLRGLSSSYFFYRIDPAGVILHVGPTLYDILGYRPEDMIGQPATFLPGEGRSPAQTGSGGDAVNGLLEMQARHRDGSTRVLECFEVPLVGEDGHIIATEGMARDVTDRLNDSQRIRRILDAAPDAMVIYGPSGTVELVNSRAEELLGKSREVMVGAPVGILIPERYHAMDHCEAEYTLGDSQAAPVHVRLSQRRLETDSGTLFIASLQDVTEYLEILRRIRRSESLLSSLVNHSNAAIFMKDTEGRFLMANERVGAILGYSVEEMIGKTDFDLYPKEFAGPIVENDRKVLRSNEAQTVEEVIEQDGELRTYVSVKFRINDLNQQAVGIGGIATDVTEFRRQREALAERTHELSRERLVLQGVLDAIPDPVFFKDESGQYVYANRAFASFLGREVSDIEGQSDKDLYPPAARKERRRQEDQAIATRSRTRTRLQARSADGRSAIFEAMRVPVVSGTSDLIGLAGFDRNVTEVEKAREAAESANRAKSAFLANMSHEIRTPMNAILGFSEILMERVKDQDHRRLLDSIRSSGRTLLTLINDILDLSKVEAGKMVVENNVVEIREVVQDMVEMFSSQAFDKGLSVSSRIADEVPRLVILDEVRLRQILQNLVSNAVKFTHQGGVSITVSSSQPEGVENHIDLVVSVSDTGIGIPLEQLDKVFGVFEQREGQEHKAYGGTGLGLAISRSLARLLGGSLTARSAEGKGSTFTATFRGVEIPALADPQNQVEESTKPVSNIGFEPARVLVVDDIETNRVLIREVLAPRGLVVDEAVTGQDALRRVVESPPDLILMDLRMPVMDGYQATRALREDPATRDIPVIVLTASAMKEDEGKAMEVADGYLRKPVSASEVIRAISAFLPTRMLEAPASQIEPAPPIGYEVPELEDLPLTEAEVESVRSVFADSRKTWNRISETLEIAALEEFGAAMARHGEEYGWPALSEWGRHLTRLAEGLQLDLLDGHTKHFERFLEALSVHAEPAD